MYYIPIKTEKEINIMRQNGCILALILDKLKKASQIGISGKTLENFAQDLIKKYKGKPSFLGFDNYPAALCFSLNEEIVHALPSDDKIIKEGDMVSLDLGFYKNGFHTDAAISFLIPPYNAQAERLLKTTKMALEEAIKKAKPGIRLGEISITIQEIIENNHCSVIKELTGHGIGNALHEDPHVFNYGDVDSGPIIKKGMVLAIEPMASLGSDKIKKGKDGYAYITQDNSLACHFEHTVAITEKGAEILTLLT
ncbi:MAG: type I methionyl aminopeptidase [Candidatus Paceibacterota bacterium]|jgi:methionyl aminopeptidase